jgi:hypothetical protein
MNGSLLRQRQRTSVNKNRVLGQGASLHCDATCKPSILKMSDNWISSIPKMVCSVNRFFGTPDGISDADTRKNLTVNSLQLQ